MFIKREGLIMNHYAILRGIQFCLMSIIGLICIGFLGQALAGVLCFGCAFLYLWLAFEEVKHEDNY
jgi:hypothetical protein